MPKIVFLIPVLIIIIGIIFYNQYLSAKPQGELPVIEFKINNQDFKIEIATTNAQKSKGLSGRTNLCDKCGMLFVFDSESYYPFWMKDTLIPLDMIWLNRFGKVVSIHTAQPEPNTPMFQLKNYTNAEPASYVLELNANEAQKIDLKVGDTIDLTPLNAIQD